MRHFTAYILGLIVAAIIYFQFFTVAGIVLLVLATGLLALYIYDVTQKQHAILRNFPIFGHGRYIADWLHPKIYQYFVEPDHDGRPISRNDRTVIYQRAKSVNDTAPFGTQLDVYEEGYEWMAHSIRPASPADINFDPRVIIGGPQCSQPYNASIYNISAMSFGSLSSVAVEALNAGARMGNFAQNTGEGGLSDHHLKEKGDIIFQFGTGYFGVRNLDGSFSEENFAQLASRPEIKMVEMKLSQGATPGHGGILPAIKATPEIARIRGIEPYKAVLSPPGHTAFSTPKEMMFFIQKLRELSGGKPVGFKICIGLESEFIAICKAIQETGILPDFITIDGGEGGTGAAPLEFSNSVGMPLYEGLTFAYNCLVGFNIKKQITLIAAGKIYNGFEIFKAISLGADACYSARGMMMALGCIQALQCNQNTCPTGVATQDPKLMKGLDFGDKSIRVYQFHKNTVHSFVELLTAAGMKHYDQITRAHVHRRIATNLTKRFDQIYPYIPEGSMLNADGLPRKYSQAWHSATAESFEPKYISVYIEED